MYFMLSKWECVALSSGVMFPHAKHMVTFGENIKVLK